MLVPYVRPQDTITQILQQTPVREASRRNPVVIGPQFNLYLNDGRDLDSAKLDFDSSGASALPYQSGSGTDLDLTSETPETTSAELYGEDLEALVANYPGSASWVTDSALDATLRSIRLDGGDLIAGTGGTLSSTLDGRQVRVGDVIKVGHTPDGGSEAFVRRRVIGLLGQVTAAAAPTAMLVSQSPLNPVTVASDAIEAQVSTSPGWTATSFTSDTATLTAMRTAGRTYQSAADNTQIGDELTVTCTTPGAAGTAVFTVASDAQGVSVSETSVDAGGGTAFQIPIDNLGYGGGGAQIVLTKASSAVVGEIIKVRIFPAYTQPAVTFTPTAADDGSNSGITLAGSYTGSSNRRYAIEVISLDGDGFTARVYDTLGEEPVISDSDSSVASALGNQGLTYSMLDDAGAFAIGQIFYADAVAATTSGTAFDGVVLDGPAYPSNATAPVVLTEIDIYQRYTGVLDAENVGSGTALTANAADWEYAASLGIDESVTGLTTPGLATFADAQGKVFLSYKALVIPSPTEGLIELDTETGITAECGENKQANWLGYGAQEAFKGNQNRVVYALRTGGDTVADFTTALLKIEKTDQVYAIAPMTDVLEVQQLVASHCATMSNKYNKNFRRCYVGTDSPGEYVYWGELAGGGYRTADLAASVVTLDEDYRVAWQFSEEDVGATITVTSLGLDFEILDVISDYEVLTDAANGLSATASPIVVTRPDTPDATVSYVSDRSKALNNRRCANVWSHNPTVDDGNGGNEVVACKFIAAEIAGLRCALLPQQGITLTEILSAEAAPSMYTIFSNQQLDTIAANGTMVVTQDSEGGDVFIRHQLTTKVDDEAALEYEDNVGVIVDEFSYAVKDEFRGYIGRRNATPDTIREIDTALKALATSFTRSQLVDRQLGPPVITFFSEAGDEGEVTVRQDGDLADTLLTYVRLRVPLPLNGINHYIDVEVSEILASEDNI